MGTKIILLYNMAISDIVKFDRHCRYNGTLQSIVLV